MRLWPKRECSAVSDSLDECLSPLPNHFRTRLLSMYAGEQQTGLDGGLYSLDRNTRIAPDGGMWLYKMCRALKPKQTLEVGLAYGFSTVYFLAAIHENGSGLHTAIDPFQYAPNFPWKGIGVAHSGKLGMAHAFRLIDEKSVFALARLASGSQKFELIFVDGNHRFDDALMDFTLSAELCPIGGCIVVDDLWMPSLQRAVSFIRKNRTDFREIAGPISGMVAFERLCQDNRRWDHYVRF